jgi:hypothetical protein
MTDVIVKCRLCLHEERAKLLYVRGRVFRQLPPGWWVPSEASGAGTPLCSEACVRRYCTGGDQATTFVPALRPQRLFLRQALDPRRAYA